MTEHKFTKEQIIKGLTCYTKDELCVTHCELFEMTTEPCYKALAEAAVDLIKRQSEDIDRLIEINSHNVVAKYEIKAEALKEFAMRLKLKFRIKYTHSKPCEDLIDNLLKEMTRRCPNCKHFVGCEAACGGVPCDGYTEGDTNG